MISEENMLDVFFLIDERDNSVCILLNSCSEDSQLEKLRSFLEEILDSKSLF